MLRIGVEKDKSASPLVALTRAKRADSIASHLREVARAQRVTEGVKTHGYAHIGWMKR
jgi:hypothetical protein